MDEQLGRHDCPGPPPATSAISKIWKVTTGNYNAITEREGEWFPESGSGIAFSIVCVWEPPFASYPLPEIASEIRKPFRQTEEISHFCIRKLTIL
jgi:hypothetical protein